MSSKKTNSQSMTGFGRGVAEAGGVIYDITLRSVNSRYLDLQFRAPRTFGIFEPEVRERIQAKLHRGRIEILVNRSYAADASAVAVTVQKPLISGLLKAFGDVLQEEGIQSATAKERLFMEIISRFDVATVNEDPEEKERQAVQKALDEALKQLMDMRGQEGKALEEDLRNRVQTLQQLKSKIEKKRTTIVVDIQKRITDRVQELTQDLALEPGRLLQEVAFLADRSDVTEELVRLDSHLAQCPKILAERPSGRKFEFLLQEIGREFNTIGSKAQDAEVQQLVVEGKSILEKCREQVMNVE